MSSKRCFKCLCVKPLADFYRHAQMGDGHLNKCKDCTKKDVGEHRLANLERIRQYDKMRSSMPHRIALRDAVFKRWVKDHPDRRKAQLQLGNAVRRGAVVPWPVCEVPDCNRKPEAHHPHYSMPLVVVWLCRPHHMQAHAASNQEHAEVA